MIKNALAAGLLLVASTSPSLAAITVNWVGVTGATTTFGPPDGTGWISNGADWVYDAFLFDSSGNLLNAPNTSLLSYPLTVGTHTFTVRGDLGSSGGLGWTLAVLTLGFDSTNWMPIAPQIGVATPPVNDLSQPQGLTAVTGTVFAIDRSVVAAPGSQIYSRSDGWTATVTSFAWREASAGNGDLVSPQSPVPNGVIDNVGVMTIVVVPTPPTFTLLVCASILGMRRRRNDSPLPRRLQSSILL